MDYVSLIHTEKFSKRRTIFRIGSKLAQLTLSPFDWQIPFPKKLPVKWDERRDIWVKQHPQPWTPEAKSMKTLSRKMSIEPKHDTIIVPFFMALGKVPLLV